MQRKILGAGLALLGFGLATSAAATVSTAEAPLTLSMSLQLSSTHFSDDAGPYKNRTATATAMLSKPLDDKLTVGGGLAYGQSSIDLSSGDGDTDLLSASAFMAYRLTPAITLDANAGYGKVALDNAYFLGTTRIDYTARTNFWNVGAGATYNTALSKEVRGLLGARYNHIDSSSRRYTDSAGSTAAGSRRDKGYATLMAGIVWLRPNGWQPSLIVNQNLSRDYATDDRSYLGYSLGIARRLPNKSTLGLSYNSVAGKAHTRQQALALSYSLQF